MLRCTCLSARGSRLLCQGFQEDGVHVLPSGSRVVPHTSRQGSVGLVRVWSAALQMTDGGFDKPTVYTPHPCRPVASPTTARTAKPGRRLPCNVTRFSEKPRRAPCHAPASQFFAETRPRKPGVSWGFGVLVVYHLGRWWVDKASRRFARLHDRVYHLGRWWVDKAHPRRSFSRSRVYHLGRWWVDKATFSTTRSSAGVYHLGRWYR